MWPFHRKVCCVYCGFLGSEPQRISVYSELRPASDALRAEIRQGHLGGWNVYCHRELIGFPHILPEIPETVAEKERAAVNIAVARWTCAHFHTFSPGRDFQAHYELYERARESRATRVWQIIGITAVVVTNAAQLLLRALRLIP